MNMQMMLMFTQRKFLVAIQISTTAITGAVITRSLLMKRSIYKVSWSYFSLVCISSMGMFDLSECIRKKALWSLWPVAQLSVPLVCLITPSYKYPFASILVAYWVQLQTKWLLPDFPQRHQVYYYSRLWIILKFLKGQVIIKKNAWPHCGIVYRDCSVMVYISGLPINTLTAV